MHIIYICGHTYVFIIHLKSRSEGAVCEAFNMWQIKPKSTRPSNLKAKIKSASFSKTLDPIPLFRMRDIELIGPKAAAPSEARPSTTGRALPKLAQEWYNSGNYGKIVNFKMWKTWYWHSALYMCDCLCVCLLCLYTHIYINIQYIYIYKSEDVNIGKNFDRLPLAPLPDQGDLIHVFL